MKKKKGLSKEERLVKALRELPNPLEDKKHRILIIFDDNRARSNQSRFDHITLERHRLEPNDIKRIPRKIKESEMEKDKERKDTYNLYIKRNNYSNEFIKISLKMDFKESNKAIVKTIFITNNYK